MIHTKTTKEHIPITNPDCLLYFMKTQELSEISLKNKNSDLLMYKSFPVKDA
jgi:hypothetical protein